LNNYLSKESGAAEAPPDELDQILNSMNQQGI